MNFSPFGSHHFSTPIPNIHQFAAKLTQDVSSTSSAFTHTLDDISLTNRYTANGIPSFTQHHHATAQQQLLAVSKSNTNYLNSQNLYAQTSTSKRQTLDQQNLDFLHLRTALDKELTENKIRRKEHSDPIQNPPVSAGPWQNFPTSSPSVVDYLSQLPSNGFPLSLQEFLKYSAESLKKDVVQPNNDLSNVNNLSNIHGGGNASGSLSTINTAHIHNNPPPVKKKKKKKPEKEKKPKPKPGEIRLSTALDGSTLYCCPECHMALPERDLLEQHLMGHNMERRFVCDICGAALKRKDHLTRHKQSHNPERPFVCSVCLKAFKRKEQLTLHFVIHSGEKRHVCTECGKGFYRKDHLRKHTRSHIARRVKAELSQQGVNIHTISS
ncbi:zinc finger protein 37-like [Anthonomus grandis grandis]|uniref:zinc finger protein 37-like n=1 Tax=Anthonomus grandis grandis TaxID=2921223 RepID=UPI0021656AD7|nr:zinc finger protein 37-like [Anthonomus grandis grandis]XP_050308435.1 zinc finger protein 37-like [Anthonomus grandis grandis]XP_050308436.1 zinc finger protein 37-like [Anthonomus grandis grandis]XP_050308437.1 zinc finger protein 37-like [Anthonomus grandis grandis]XP_050308438.1 zinc finger protein 37-like [Anthonomus grandis grandis]XP_050308439.1 zinc finger protein 37-like [Anthonomus grandis grandis]XP_050308440.1 zinc finger protein 37-like [Anthonomus grandis grandis]XP_05030844